MWVDLCSPKRCRSPKPPVPVNVTLYGNGVLAHHKVKMRSLRWALCQYDCIQTKRGNLDTETEIQGEYHVNMKTEIRVISLQAKEHQSLLADHQKLGRDMEQILPHSPHNEPSILTH